MTSSEQPIDPKVMKRRIRIWTSVAVSVAVIIGIGLVLALPKQQPPPPLPNPNGWDSFLTAAKKLPSGDLGERPSVAELKEYLAARQDSLKLLREGLQQETRVPTATFTNNQTEGLNNIAALKRLALTLFAEARLARLESRSDDAIKSYVDEIKFSQQCTRGGFLIHYMLAIACEASGFDGLERLSSDLNAQQCRQLAASLVELDHAREPLNQVLKTEAGYARSQGFLVHAVTRSEIDPAIKNMQSKEAELRHRYVVLEAGLAARAYQLEKGKAPQRISDLVPEYLKTSPVDPATAKELEFSLVAKYLQSK